jgi:hypothetical protein
MEYTIVYRCNIHLLVCSTRTNQQGFNLSWNIVDFLYSYKWPFLLVDGHQTLVYNLLMLVNLGIAAAWKNDTGWGLIFVHASFLLFFMGQNPKKWRSYNNLILLWFFKLHFIVLFKFHLTFTIWNFTLKLSKEKKSVGNETLIYHNKQKILVKWMHISYLNHKIMKMFGENVDSNIPTKALVSDSFKI